MSTATKATHTPGPWYISAQGKYVRHLGGHGYDIADLQAFGGTREEAIANANLIAAAPEMLDALEQLLSYLREFWPLEPLFSTYEHRQALSIADAEAAIRKAKGEAA